MQSGGHRANILNPRWREVGIGAVHSTTARGAFTRRPVTIITADFGVRPLTELPVSGRRP